MCVCDFVGNRLARMTNTVMYNHNTQIDLQSTQISHKSTTTISGISSKNPPLFPNVEKQGGFLLEIPLIVKATNFEERLRGKG